MSRRQPLLQFPLNFAVSIIASLHLHRASGTVSLPFFVRPSHPFSCGSVVVLPLGADLLFVGPYLLVYYRMALMARKSQLIHWTPLAFLATFPFPAPAGSWKSYLWRRRRLICFLTLADQYHLSIGGGHASKLHLEVFNDFPSPGHSSAARNWFCPACHPRWFRLIAFLTSRDRLSTHSVISSSFSCVDRVADLTSVLRYIPTPRFLAPP